MPANVFKAQSVTELTQRVAIDVPRFRTVEEIKYEENDNVYKGPSIEEMEAEIANLRANWEEDLRAMRKRANDEAGRIIEDARAQSFEMYKVKQNEARDFLESAKAEASETIRSANDESEKIKKEVEQIRYEAKQEGYRKGYEEGFDKALSEGGVELDHMIEKLKRIFAETINKRNEIIDISESHIIEIAIIIAKRVVKMITERDRSVVIRNIQEALRKIKGRAKVTIRVNIDDVEMSARYKDEFYQILDKIEGVAILEDPNVDVGGCIIETDFGDIDARISTQLNEIETAIKQVEPIKGL